MTAEKTPTAVGKFLRKVLPVAGQLIKGQVKSVPFVGNLIVDGIEIIRGKDVATGQAKTHNKFVYAIELVGAVTLAYLVVKGIIPVERLIEFIKAII